LPGLPIRSDRFALRRFCILNPESTPVRFGTEHVPDLAGAHWRQLDEVQGHIAEFTETEWPAVIAAARAFATKIA
jgi:hypothetical protein